MKHIAPFILAATLLLVSCHKNTFTIEGTLANGANKTIYIEELTPEEPLFIDSLKLDSKGHFSFKYKMPYESFYNVHVSEYDYVVLLPQKGEKIKITGDYNHFEMTYKVEGSPQSTLLWQLQDYSNHGVDRLKEIVALNDHNKSTLNEADYAKAKKVTDSIYLDAFKEQQEYITHFLSENQGSLATIIALYKPFNNHALIDSKESFDWYEFVLEGLEQNKADNPHTLHFKNTVEYLRHQRGPEPQVVDIDLSAPIEPEEKK